MDRETSQNAKRNAERHLDACDSFRRSRLRLEEARLRFGVHVDIRPGALFPGIVRRVRLLEENDTAFSANPNTAPLAAGRK